MIEEASIYIRDDFPVRKRTRTSGISVITAAKIMAKAVTSSMISTKQLHENMKAFNNACKKNRKI